MSAEHGEDAVVSRTVRGQARARAGGYRTSHPTRRRGGGRVAASTDFGETRREWSIMTILRDDSMCSDKELLIGYLYGECDPADRRRMDAHVTICSACQSELYG